ncbi:hypothetical protein MVES1_000232 [Malassezia vespertilionis]|uniref:Saccharopine dehydrogenase NADP binding domain-containing protein n=1 Tax=Malassezia vespertilionis TaxID=2020962 RepID=A0A2N1JFL4_9BASI|nr:uncharacterized protein MVES1_000232 [Malassezia vespertilionis]PKI85332.1 hypothetical protein MVES_000221 [Malassezia vespertilionis]WFD04907.1 hypothetical protein MVES1_000232 [Malassezia vespertilionis]
MTAQYDVILYGATGFTGNLAAQYLASHPQQPTLAFAGRNQTKIRETIESLTGISKERAESIGVLEASMNDNASLHRMAQSAKVVLNMVGPYAMLGGFEVAQAAAENGCCYVDLTGESHVYEHIANELDAVAKKTRAILLPSAAFDSLLFDLSTYLAVQQIKQKAGIDTETRLALCGYHVKSKVSGGTIASIVGKAAFPNSIRFTQPYMLSPVNGTQRLHDYWSRRLPQFGKWGSYSLFAAHNTRVVNRSWALLQLAGAPQQYGPTFMYEEGLVASSRFGAWVLSCVFFSMTWLITHVRAFGTLLKRMIPQGTGGSMTEQLQGFADIRTLAVSCDGRTQSESKIFVQGDPGYLKTAAMVSEVALTLALERAKLSTLAQEGGVHTTATVGGEVVRDRLAKYAGLRFEARDVSHAM